MSAQTHRHSPRGYVLLLLPAAFLALLVGFGGIGGGSTGGAAAADGIFLAFAAVVLYMAPTVVAIGRHAVRTPQVVIYNLFLGWTFFGWVVALAMASGSTHRGGRP